MTTTTIVTVSSIRDAQLLPQLNNYLSIQSLPPREWIIIFDGILEDKDIIQKLKEKNPPYKIKTINSEITLEPFTLRWAINVLKGYKHSGNSEWLWILDTDIIVPRNYIKNCINSGYDVTTGIKYEPFRGKYRPTKIYGEKVVSGGCRVVKKKLMEQWTLDPYAPDTVFIKNVKEMGYKVGLTETTFFIHTRASGFSRHRRLGYSHVKLKTHPISKLLLKSLLQGYRYGFKSGLGFLIGVIEGILE